MKLSDIYYDSHFGEFEELFRQSGVPVHFRKGEAIPTDYKTGIFFIRSTAFPNTFLCTRTVRKR